MPTAVCRMSAPSPRRRSSPVSPMAVPPRGVFQPPELQEQRHRDHPHPRRLRAAPRPGGTRPSEELGKETLHTP